MRCRDELIEMMLRRIRRTQAMAKEQLDDLHDQHRAIEENLISIFGQVLETEPTQDTDAAFGRQVRKLLSEQGGVAALAQQCETVSAWHRGNDLPLLWPIHARHRVLLFRLLDLMVVQSATQDRSLLEALAIVSSHRHARRNDVLGSMGLSLHRNDGRHSLPNPGLNPAHLIVGHWGCSCSSTWPTPCRAAIFTSSAPRPWRLPATTGQNVMRDCRPTALLSAFPNEARISPLCSKPN